MYEVTMKGMLCHVMLCYVMSCYVKLFLICQWENDTVKERTGYPSTYAEIK